MIKQDQNPDKLYIEGFASYMEGCTLVAFSEPSWSPGSALLFQESINPTIYNKLSCHLPWIADQYDMVFNAGDTDPECTEGVGDINSIQEEAETRECRCITSYDQISEAPCILPFYWEGKLNEGCNMLEHDGFLIRVFYCPIYNTVNKINGINSFTWDDFLEQFINSGLCPAEGTNTATDTGTPTVNATYQGCDDPNGDGDYSDQITRIFPFQPCKNNCPGVSGVTIVAGGAALVAGGALAATSTITPVLSLFFGGVAAVGGNMVAQEMCLGPLYCRARSGQCCQFRFRRRLVCPVAC